MKHFHFDASIRSHVLPGFSCLGLSLSCVHKIAWRQFWYAKNTVASKFYVTVCFEGQYTIFPALTSFRDRPSPSIWNADHMHNRAHPQLPFLYDCLSINDTIYTKLLHAMQKSCPKGRMRLAGSSMIRSTLFELTLKTVSGIANAAHSGG